MVVTIVLVGVMAAVGSLMIAKLAPSFLVSSQAEQALTPREAALWRLREDFRRSLVYGTNPPGCTSSLNLNVVSDVTGTVTSQVARYFMAGTTTSQLWVSSPWASGMLLDNVTMPTGCAFNWQSGTGATPTKLRVVFNFTAGTTATATVTTPVSAILYTYAAAPYASAIFPVAMSAATPTTVAISGTSFTGMTGVTFVPAGITVTTPTVLGDSVISATVNSPAPGAFDLVVTTPDGRTTLKSAVIFN